MLCVQLSVQHHNSNPATCVHREAATGRFLSRAERANIVKNVFLNAHGYTISKAVWPRREKVEKKENAWQTNAIYVYNAC